MPDLALATALMRRIWAAPRPSNAPTATDDPEASPVWHLQQDARATADSERRDDQNGPSDTPPGKSYSRWHADEAFALAKLAELTARKDSNSWLAANDMDWSTK